MAVRRSVDDGIDANATVRAGLVLDNDGLAPALLSFCASTRAMMSLVPPA